MDPRHSPVSAEVPEDHRTPSRLSALYQYHNAPEVAPAHGLEYDDTIYPVSDKFPVLRETPYGHRHPNNYHGFDSESNLPPRIIFGMKVRTFFLVAAVMTLVVCGAAVGGVLGGRSMNSGQSDMTYSGQSNNSQSSTTTTSPSSTTTTSTFSAATPTYTPLSDCPASNGTNYTSTIQDFVTVYTKFCDLTNPLTKSNSQNISAAFVYSFSDCVDACASYSANAGVSCTAAVYEPKAARPYNCWIGEAGDGPDTFVPGVDVAILVKTQ